MRILWQSTSNILSGVGAEGTLKGGGAPQSHGSFLRTLSRSAFTLVEVMVGIGVTAVMLVALYGGIAYAFGQVRISRENLRATQILQEKMEVVRLFNWDQVVNLPGYIPTSFTAGYYALNPTNSPSGNFVYTGTVTVASAPVSETYSNDLRSIKIQVTWQSGNVTHKRQMTTFVARQGLQNYVY